MNCKICGKTMENYLLTFSCHRCRYFYFNSASPDYSEIRIISQNNIEYKFYNYRDETWRLTASKYPFNSYFQSSRNVGILDLSNTDKLNSIIKLLTFL